MHRSRYLATGWMVALLAATGAAPIAAQDPAPQRGGVVNLSMFEDPDTLDPTLAGTAGAREAFINMCEKLYDIDADGAIVPQLATALPEVSEDGLTMTIPVREGVKFNDGTPFDAAAVAMSIERHRTFEGSKRKSELSSITATTAPDATHVVLTLAKRDAALTAQLSDRAGMVMSPAQLTALGADFGNSPVCVGPFEFVERVAGDHITLQRSDDYYDSEHVYLDQVIYHPIGDETVRSANLRSGDLQLVDRLATTDVAAFKGDPAFVVVERTSNAYTGLTVNIANANGIAGEPGAVDNPLSNDGLREAFDKAIDRDQINQLVYNGLQVAGCGPISPANPYYDGVACPARDLDGARALVQASGVATPIQVELKMASSPVNVRLGELLQSQVAEAGFELAVTPLDNVTAFQDQNDGNFDIMLAPWSGRVDPDANIYRFQYSTGTDNYPRAVDPEIDALLDQARSEYDPAVRKDLYHQIVERLKVRRSVIYFQHQVLYAAHPVALQGFDLFVDGMPRLKSVFLAQG
jgi:peptide/nickel transport system substrate-binding protein